MSVGLDVQNLLRSTFIGIWVSFRLFFHTFLFRVDDNAVSYSNILTKNNSKTYVSILLISNKPIKINAQLFQNTKTKTNMANK